MPSNSYYLDMTGEELEELLRRGGGGGDIKSIYDFGGVGDGQTNDTAALKAAAASGDSVYFPEGTYLLYEQIDMTDDIRWWGDGECSVIKLMPYDQSRPEEYGGRTVYNTYMMTQSENSNGYSVYLRDIVLDANKEGYDADILNNGSSRYDHTTCMDMYQPKNIYMHNVIIRNALIEGCYIYGPSGIVIISDCQFVNNGYPQEDASGLHIEGNHQNTVITNCIFNENGFHGLLFGGTLYANVSNVSCSNNGYDGLVLWGGASYNTISNVYCSGNRGGVYLKSQYSPWQGDAIDSDWLTYASGNIINGIITKENEYGIMFGFSKDTNINGWNCIDDNFAVGVCIDVNSSVAEYITNDVTGTICNAFLNPTKAKAYKFYDDVSKFDIKLISGTENLIEENDWYVPPGQIDVTWESGRLSNSNGGTEQDDSGSIRTAEYIAIEPDTTYKIEHSGNGSLAIFYYSDNSGAYIGREYVDNGSTTTTPSSAAYFRLTIEGETNLSTTVAFDPALPSS